MTTAHNTEHTLYDEHNPREFTATVTEVREHSRAGGRPLFQIALDYTAFVPVTASGDSPAGVLLATAPSGAVLQAPITQVTQDASGTVWHTTVKPMQPGTVVTGRVATGPAAKER